jgi:hypothetical protein
MSKRRPGMISGILSGSVKMLDTVASLRHLDFSVKVGCHRKELWKAVGNGVGRSSQIPRTKHAYIETYNAPKNEATIMRWDDTIPDCFGESRVMRCSRR